MQPLFSVYFHGASGDKILKIIESGVLQPDIDGKIFLGRHSWESCFMHGGDRQRKAAFVIKVKMGVTDDATMIFSETPGVRDTVQIQTNRPIAVAIIEMYVRRLQPGVPAVVDRIAGVTAIKQYLNAAGQCL
ncbi:hypothetical protein [Paraburkholderia terrae]|uniref:Uncharacterized protein n=1 Tax=Paraburkholderia terrae TaxID=311230 RepID=A0A2I8F404_9BURK|nr:hypothetical protein [Paraburkholderia terrae]AUT66448.1 hypothetical protein C2L65_42960 [Paraburkholderia terrae]